jgi:hypothetical protein
MQKIVRDFKIERLTYKIRGLTGRTSPPSWGRWRSSCSSCSS